MRRIGAHAVSIVFIDNPAVAHDAEPVSVSSLQKCFKTVGTGLGLYRNIAKISLSGLRQFPNVVRIVGDVRCRNNLTHVLERPSIEWCFSPVVQRDLQFLW